MLGRADRSETRLRLRFCDLRSLVAACQLCPTPLTLTAYGRYKCVFCCRFWTVSEDYRRADSDAGRTSQRCGKRKEEGKFRKWSWVILECLLKSSLNFGHFIAGNGSTLLHLSSYPIRQLEQNSC